LGEFGLRVSFGRHVEETDAFASSSIGARIEDLQEAFAQV
jgi:muramoyltetrapeptide carboxypeptidase LdcA involved in peptidoglycan recycling